MSRLDLGSTDDLARQVDVLIFTQVEINDLSRSDSDHMQGDDRIGCACRRIALLACRHGAISVQLISVQNVDSGFIDTSKCDVGFIRRPPVPGISIKFFLRDEFRDTVANDV